MNSNKLLSVLNDVRLLKFVSVGELQQLVNDYPYFQQGHILLAKKYQLENHVHFDDALHLAAVYSTDRKNLHHLVVNGIEPREKISPVDEVMHNEVMASEEEITRASFSDAFPVEEPLVEEDNELVLEQDNATLEATVVEELETAFTITATVPVDELEYASMSDALPTQDNVLDEDNEEAIAEENSSTEATALEELETAAQPTLAEQESELSFASMSDNLPLNELELDEENYEILAEENTITEATAVEELEIAAGEPTHTNRANAGRSFNINEPHTFTDWIKFIQNMPRSLQHTSSAPDYQPISVPEQPKTLKVEADNDVAMEVEVVPIEHTPELLADEPVDNIEAIDVFVAETLPAVKTEPAPIPVKQLADKSIEESDELLTETLARVYEEQELYNKAIRVYAKLSLKFPEKSLYFASLIKELKSKL